MIGIEKFRIFFSLRFALSYLLLRELYCIQFIKNIESILGCIVLKIFQVTFRCLLINSFEIECTNENKFLIFKIATFLQKYFLTFRGACQ